MKIDNNIGDVKDGPIPNLKVVILGDLGVGKTCLRSQFIYHIFTNAYKATIGGDYLTTTVMVPRDEVHNRSRRLEQTVQQMMELGAENEDEHDNSEDTLTGCQNMPEKVNLQIWDTAGQERFNSISQAFYRGTDVAILVYDITNYESVLSLRDWFKRFIEHCHVERPGVMIIGNKIDKESERCVDRDEIREILNKNMDISIDAYVRDWDTDLLEVSCKKRDLVDEVFRRAAQVGVELLTYSGDKNAKNMLSFDSIDLQQGIGRASSSRCLC